MRTHTEATSLSARSMKHSNLLHLLSSKHLTAAVSTLIGIVEMAIITLLIVVAFRTQSSLLDTCAMHHAMSPTCTIPAMMPGLVFIPAIFAFCLSPLYVMYVSAPLLAEKDPRKWPHAPLYAVEITAIQKILLEYFMTHAREHYIRLALRSLDELTHKKHQNQYQVSAKTSAHRGAKKPIHLPLEIVEMILICIDDDVLQELNVYYDRLNLEIGTHAHKHNDDQHASQPNVAPNHASTGADPVAPETLNQNAGLVDIQAGNVPTSEHIPLTSIAEIESAAMALMQHAQPTHNPTNANTSNAVEDQDPDTENADQSTDEHVHVDPTTNPQETISVWLADLALFMGFTHDPLGIRSHVLFLIESPIADRKSSDRDSNLIFFALFSRDLAIIMFSLMVRVCMMMLLSKQRFFFTERGRF